MVSFTSMGDPLMFFSSTSAAGMMGRMRRSRFPRPGRIRRTPAVLAVLSALVLLSGIGSPARAEPAGSGPAGGQRVAPGVTFSTVQVTASHGVVRGDLLTVDLTNPRIRVDLLHPSSVAQREVVSGMANDGHAVAGINADFFNISETHPGVPPTGSSDGPEITGGKLLKAAVPDGQRFGPALPPGTHTTDVLAVGADRRGRLTSVTIAGTVRTAGGPLAVSGLNQYALPVGGIGAYTSAWGTVSRQRATCGTDTDRNAACVADTAEVLVHHGRVASVSPKPGAGAIAPGDTVLVGREAGADALRRLTVGSPARVAYAPVPAGHLPLRFAVGGFPILRDGTPLSGLGNDTENAPRTSAGIGNHGRTLYLLVVDGRSELSGGLSVPELAGLMRTEGATDAVNLDGGGSSEFVLRDPGQTSATVRNHPSDGTERAVANGIGVFTTGT